MKNIIKTQEGALVNLNNILQIVPQQFDFGDAAVFTLTAQPISVCQINEETLDDCIQLCAYDSAEKLTSVFHSFSEWLESSEHTLFTFPADDSFDMTIKSPNGEVMKVGGSGCGKTRYFRKPNLRCMETL